MKKLLTLPNILTGIRFALIPVLIVLFYTDQETIMGLVTFTVFILAAATDWFDGYLARKYNSESVFGKLMDPLADKVLVTTALVMLIQLQRIPAWLSLLIICREIVITGFRGLAASTGKVVAAGQMGKLKANFQYFGIGMLLFPQGIVPIPFQYEIALVLLYISLALGIWSGVDYFYKLRDVFLETAG